MFNILYMDLMIVAVMIMKFTIRIGSIPLWMMLESITNRRMKKMMKNLLKRILLLLPNLATSPQSNRLQVIQKKSQMKKAVTGGKHSKMEDTSGKRGGGTGSSKFEAAPANSEEGSGEKIPNPNPPTVQSAVSSGNTKLKPSIGSKEKVSYYAADQKMLNQKKHKGCLMHDEEEPSKADEEEPSKADPAFKSYDDQT